MRAGDLDRRISIERSTWTESPSGETIETWTELAARWASFTQSGGREFFAQVQTQSERKVVFRCRWVEGVTPVDRVLCDGEIYNIQEARRVGRKHGLELHCKAS